MWLTAEELITSTISSLPSLLSVQTIGRRATKSTFMEHVLWYLDSALGAF